MGDTCQLLVVHLLPPGLQAGLGHAEQEGGSSLRARCTDHGGDRWLTVISRSSVTEPEVRMRGSVSARTSGAAVTTRWTRPASHDQQGDGVDLCLPMQGLLRRRPDSEPLCEHPAPGRHR
jgi:hypothetical protein